MRPLKTPAWGLITLGVLLLGAQLVLYLGAHLFSHEPSPSPVYSVPVRHLAGIPGILGGALIVIGLSMRAPKPRESQDPRDGRSIPAPPK